jgi:hypothetical protein
MGEGVAASVEERSPKRQRNICEEFDFNDLFTSPPKK